MTSLSESRRIAEKIARYRNNFRLFIEEQLKISGKPMKIWPCQEPVIQVIERQMHDRGYVRLACLKARQVGLSTLSEAFVSWRTMLWPNVNAIVIADEAERAKTLFEISRSFYDQMDDDIRPVGRYVTKRELVFANPSQITRGSDPGLRSRIVVDSAAKKSVAIGARWDISHLSEAARFLNPEFVIDGIIPAVHMVPGTAIIMESSAEMSGTWWRDFCSAAERGENGFEFVFVPGYLQPEYSICPVCIRSFCDHKDHADKALKVLDPDGDERHIMAEFKVSPGYIQFMRNKLREMGGDYDLYRQSYPLTSDDAWVTPGLLAFSAKHLREQRSHILPPVRRCEIHPGPSILDSQFGRLSIWEEPKMGVSYDIGVDVAQGLGKDDDNSDDHDYSVACILSRGDNKQVAEWRSRAIDPFELADHLYWLGKYYNEAQIAVETNGIGMGTNGQLVKLGYSNCYFWRYRDEGLPRYSRKVGWETSPRSKPWLVGFTNHQLINNRFIIRSEILLKEMEVFVRKGPREWGATAGYKDDACYAFMIALIASDDENFEKYFGLVRDGEGQKKDLVKLPNPWEADLEWVKRMKPERAWDPWDY